MSSPTTTASPPSPPAAGVAPSGRRAVHRTVVDGVPVLWSPRPGPLEAVLVVGVGVRDEEFLTAGITHLVEHLVLETLEEPPGSANGTTGLGSTSFSVSGSPEEVVAFLDGVCRALADLPVDRLEVERGVLQAEGSSVVPPHVGIVLSQEYGLRDVGLAGAGPATAAPKGAQVRAWARRFTAGRAALALTGPPPPGLRLPLPTGGAASPRRRPPRRALPDRCRLDGPPGMVAVAFDEVPLTPASGVLSEVLRLEVLDALRTGAGLSYEVSGGGLLLGDGLVASSLLADVREGQEGAGAAALLDTLERVAREGPSERSLRRVRRDARTHVQEPESVLCDVERAAAACAAGESLVWTDEDEADAADALSVQEVRHHAGRLCRRLVLVLPEDVTTPEGFSAMPEEDDEPVEGVVHPAVVPLLPGRPRVVLGDEAVSVRVDGAWRTARFDDVVALLEEDEDVLVLVRSDGCALAVAPAAMRRGRRLAEALRARVPAELQVRAEPRPPG